MQLTYQQLKEGNQQNGQISKTPCGVKEGRHTRLHAARVHLREILKQTHSSIMTATGRAAPWGSSVWSVDRKGHEGLSGGDGNILYLEWSG